MRSCLNPTNDKMTVKLFSCNSFYTGTVALVFTALGVLISGAIVSWKKPKARILASWNAFVGILTVVGFFSYSFIGCPENENSLFLEQAKITVNTSSLGCVDKCHCEFIPYAPVCGENNFTYISACHAGCKGLRLTASVEKQFYDCECVRPFNFDNTAIATSYFKEFKERNFSTNNPLHGGNAIPGACPVDCFKNFMTFLIIMCVLKFLGSTSRTSYFLIQLRSVPVEDKTVAIGFGTVMMSLLAFIPSPIVFGWLFDRMCLVWGKTCTEKSNCWLYDSRRLRYTLNYSASVFLLVAALCDCINCYLVKDLNIFDEDKKKAHKEKIASNIELSKLSGNI